MLFHLLMVMSRFQQLQAISEADYNTTYEYVGKNFKFITDIARKLADYIGCGLDKISIIDTKDTITPIRSFIQDAIFIDKECFFSV
ncbi:hypothetical protein B7486_51065 [cyanobacterium TDX16]|nr:hypothetical protein B7486_51065 [cyanobacterium TDX16]